MADELLSSTVAAYRLGISVTTLYDWLARSKRGEFFLRGQPFCINWLQGGARGQGRIRIEAAEIERMKDAMRVRPRAMPRRRPPTSSAKRYPGIHVPLGRPGN